MMKHIILMSFRCSFFCSLVLYFKILFMLKMAHPQSHNMKCCLPCGLYVCCTLTSSCTFVCVFLILRKVSFTSL